MAKFEVELQLQGLKLRVRAEREEDVMRITGGVGQQLSGLFQPSTDILDMSARMQPALTAPAENSQGTDRGKGRAKPGRHRKPARSDGIPSQSITWQHDPAKWGMPKQTWSSCQKILWTLYVVAKETDHRAVSGPAIAETFNTLFRQFGSLVKQNMSRDLGQLKKRTPAQVMDDTTKSPFAWYLTEEGNKEAEKLVAEGKNTNSVT